jgi:hypothetical protein
MMARLRLYLLCAMFLTLPANVFAGVMLSVSSPDDLLNLSINQEFTIDVSLSGLVPGDQLDLLSADILFPTSVLSVVNLPTPGDAILDPVNNIFISGSAAGSVFGFYFAVTDPISNDGKFFSFTLKALQAGSGMIEFDAGSPPVVDGNAGLLTHIDFGPGLTVNVLPPIVPTSMIPEPAAFTLWSLLAFAGMFGCWRKR